VPEHSGARGLAGPFLLWGQRRTSPKNPLGHPGPHRPRATQSPRAQTVPPCHTAPHPHCTPESRQLPPCHTPHCPQPTFSCLRSSSCRCRKYWSLSCCFTSWCLSCSWCSSISVCRGHATGEELAERSPPPGPLTLAEDQPAQLRCRVHGYSLESQKLPQSPRDTSSRYQGRVGSVSDLGFIRKPPQISASHLCQMGSATP
jgi:hypothetical protein